MKTYTVQANDTPMTIAHRFTGNRERYSELIAANPQKGLAAVPRGLAGPPTFDSLHIGEKINLPHAWLGTGAAPPTVAPPSITLGVSDAGSVVPVTVGESILITMPAPIVRQKWQVTGTGTTVLTATALPPIPTSPESVMNAFRVTAVGQETLSYQLIETTTNRRMGSPLVFIFAAVSATPSCTPVSMTLAEAWVNILDVMNAGVLQCSSASPFPYSPIQQVCDFQANYQAQAQTTGLLPLIPNDASGASPVDGELGPNTINAMNAYLTSVNAGYSVACNNNVLVAVAPGTARSTPSGGGGAVITGGGSNYGTPPGRGPTAPRTM
jgi:hypothetical protein